jgi:hypothetical protein
MNVRTIRLVLVGVICAVVAAWLVPTPEISASGTHRGNVQAAVASLEALLQQPEGEVPAVALRAAVMNLHRAVEASTAAARQAEVATKRRGGVNPCSPVCGCCLCGYACSTTNPTGRPQAGAGEEGALRRLSQASRAGGETVPVEDLRPLVAQLAAWAAN